MEEKEIVSYCMGCGKIKHKHDGANWLKANIYDRQKYLYSHGYCPPCVEKLMAEYKAELERMEK